MTAETSPKTLPPLVRALAVLSAAYGLGLLVYLILRFTLGEALWWLGLLHNFAPYYFMPLFVLIPLLLILRARPMALRLLPLLLIGLLMYGPRWLPHVAVAAQGETLKIVTFNVLALTEEFGDKAAWLATTDADLILLQEGGGLNPDTAFTSLEDEYPYLVNLTGTTVFMLSRFPIRDPHIVDLGGWFIDRVEIETESGPLAVYNVHMEWPFLLGPRLPFNFGGSTLDLLLQYDESRRDPLIRRLLEIIAGESLPYIVAGDFNTSDNSPIYGEIAAEMRDSFRESNSGLGATWPAALGDDPIPTLIPPLLRLDYVWHSTGLRAVSTQIGPNLGSDHLPVIAELALNS